MNPKAAMILTVFIGLVVGNVGFVLLRPGSGILPGALFSIIPMAIFAIVASRDSDDPYDNSAGPSS